MGSYLIRNIKCVCGSHQYIKFFERKDREHNFEIIKCRDCGLARTIPIPDSSKQRYKYYGIDRYSKNRKIVSSLMEKILKQVFKFKKRGKLLEIGCSVGYLLRLAKNKGFEIQGIELDVKAMEYANKLLGKGTVINTTLQEAKFPDKHFDVVVMSHVLEHISNPGNLLREIKRILKNNGIMVISAPNLDGFWVKIKKEKWPGLRPKEHIWQFGITSLRELLEKQGFKVKRIRTWGLYYSLYSVIKSIRENIHDKGSAKHIIYSLLNWLVGKFGFGDNMFVIAVKT